MKKQKVLCGINAGFGALFFAVFAFLLSIILIHGYTMGQASKTYVCSLKQKVGIIVCFVLLSAAVFTVVALFNRFLNDGRKLRGFKLNPTALIFICVGFMLALQLTAAYLLQSAAVHDLHSLKYYTDKIAVTGKLDVITSRHSRHYMVRYQNNLGILYLLSLIYRIQFLLTGSLSDGPAIFVNTLALNGSVLMAVLLTRKIYGMKRAMLVFMLCFFFAPFYTYTSFFYTDSLSMPFVIGAFYVFSFIESSENLGKRLALSALCGLILFVGFALKGSAAVALIAIVMYAVAKLNFKRALCVILTIVVAFGGLLICYKESAKAVIPEEMSEKYEFPLSHWLMMGSRGYGNFNAEDARYTLKRKSKSSKDKADMRKFRQRMTLRSKGAIYRQLRMKTKWMWEDGTYYISTHIDEPVRRNFLHEFVLRDGKHYFLFYAASCAYQLMLIFFMALSGLSSMFRRKIDLNFLIRLTVTGALCFFLLWEAKSRYLMNFTPLFIILCAQGIEFAHGACLKISKFFRKFETSAA